MLGERPRGNVLLGCFGRSTTLSSSDCVLKGHIVASGGAGNDIQVMLLEETNFLHWHKGHRAQTLFNSGKLTAVRMAVSIVQSSTYCLVLDNALSASTEKVVAVED